MNQVTRNDPRDAWLAAALDARAEDGQPRHDCPLPERIWDAVHLQLSSDERLQVIDHLAECPACAEAWRLAAELTPADELTAQPPENASRCSSARDGRSALLIAAAAVILIALGLVFMMRRPATQPDTASIGPPPTSPPTSVQSTPAPAAVQQTPNSVPAPTTISPPPPVSAPRAALADEVAIRNLIVAYQHLIATRDWNRLLAIQPGVTTVELEAFRREPPVVLDGQAPLHVEVQSVRVDGRTATARIRRRETVLIDGQRQERTSVHHLTFEKTAAGNWIVVSARPEEPPLPPVAVPDEDAIRRVIATYQTAIETKDIGLFLFVYPGAAGKEQAARLNLSFRSIESQQVTITIDVIRVDGEMAIARISRQDVITVRGRRQAASSRQTLRFEKSDSGWIIKAIEPANR